MNSLILSPNALERARRQFCLDMGLSWEEYVRQSEQKVYIRKVSYKEGIHLINTEGARVYEGRNDFFLDYIVIGADIMTITPIYATQSRSCIPGL